MPLETVQREHTIRNADPQLVYQIVTDYENNPKVFPDFTKVRVLSTEGNRQQVEFQAKVTMIEVRYVLDIEHDPERLTTWWKYVEGKVVSDSVGGWKFTARGDDTHVEYHAGIAVNAPLPKFVTNKVATYLMGTSIGNLFTNLETEVRRRQKAG